MRHITRTFLAGLATVLPVVATLYLVYWLASSAESILGAGLRLVLSDRFYWPGLGVALGAAIIFAVGLLMHTWLARTIFSWWERLLYRLPLIKSIYGAFRDLLSFVAAPRDKALQQVVAVRIGETDMRLLGFVTRDNLQDLPKGLAEADAAAVYLPMSYQIGGYTVLVPRSALQPVEMSLEDAMRFAVTAGLSTAGGGDTKAKT